MSRPALLVVGLVAVVFAVTNIAATEANVVPQIEELADEFVAHLHDAAAEYLPAGVSLDDVQWFQDVDKKWCPNNSYFEFIPVFRANVRLGDHANFNASCFPSYTVALEGNSTSATVTFSTQGSASSPLCGDSFLVASRYKKYLFINSALSPKKTLSISKYMPHEYDSIKAVGLDIFVLPCGLLGSVESVLKTVSLFNGTNTVQNNVEFLSERKVYGPFKAFNKTQTIDKSLVQSGDNLAVMRLDGLDPLVMWGTGGATGHSTIAVRDPKDGELYVCESTAANPFGVVYWPPPYGVVRHKWDDWIQLAIKADYHVAVLPLAPDVAAHFNETAFWEWYNEVEGMPYGFHNFMYSFMDTADPMRNLPAPIEAPAFSLTLDAMARLLPNTTSGVSFWSLFMEGINHRMGGEFCPDIGCVYDYLNKHDMTLGELTAEVEMDDWRYNDGNFSMVCSVFVARSWIHSFGDYWPTIQGAEQTPKDNYQMNIYSPTHFTADNCPMGLHTTPAGTYCQLMGEYELYLDGYNTIPVYAGMNNKCPAQWPDYTRCPADNPKCC